MIFNREGAGEDLAYQVTAALEMEDQAYVAKIFWNAYVI